MGFACACEARLQNAPKAGFFAAGKLAKFGLRLMDAAEVLASAQKNLTDFPVLRHLACREDTDIIFATCFAAFELRPGVGAQWQAQHHHLHQR